MKRPFPHNFAPPALALLTCLYACGQVPIEKLPDIQDFDTADALNDTTIDINQDVQIPPQDVAGDASKCQLGDAAPGPEKCNNALDDNCDGRTDEGCWSAPNLRPDATWLDFGLVQIGGATALAPTLTFTASGKNQGMVLVARDATASQKGYVWAEQMIAPTGVKILNEKDWLHSINRTAAGIAGSTALLGESPEAILDLTPGTWTFSFVRAAQTPWNYSGTPSKGYLQLGLMTRPDDANKPLVLDLDIYLVGGTTGMSPTEFEASPQWKAMRAQVEAVWNAKIPNTATTYGVTLGTVHFYSIDGDPGTKYKYLDNVLSGQGPTDPENELVTVYEVTGSMNPKSTAATLVITSGLDDKGLSVAAGLSQLGGIPGLAGSRLSGMAMAIDPKTFADDVTAVKAGGQTQAGIVWGVILAHEIGHFLGLWHTDEHDGAIHDPLNDTPECTATDSTGLVTAATCKQNSLNLMFWAPRNDGSKLQTQPSQHEVVRRSVALHP